MEIELDLGRYAVILTEGPPKRRMLISTVGWRPDPEIVPWYLCISYQNHPKGTASAFVRKTCKNRAGSIARKIVRLERHLASAHHELDKFNSILALIK